MYAIAWIVTCFGRLDKRDDIGHKACGVMGSARHVLAALVVASVLPLAIACDSSPTTPTMADLTGSWDGTTCPPSHIDSCVIGFKISQMGSSLSGTYGTTSGNGTLTGTVTGSQVVMGMTTVFPPTTPCPSSTVTVTVSGNQMTGAINTSCANGVSGTVPLSASRQ
jgi:hypothetical protein